MINETEDQKREIARLREEIARLKAEVETLRLERDRAEGWSMRPATGIGRIVKGPGW